MSEALHVAIIGCGDITGRHLQAFQKETERAVIAAVCDTNEERARRAAQEPAGARARIVTDWRDLLVDHEIEAVDICLPHHLHAPVSIAFAEAGKHILCEKPLALNPEECDRMIAAARASGVVLMHLEPQRMGQTVETAAAMIAEGKLGKITALQGAFAYWQRAELNRDWRADPARSGGGHLMDGGIHFIDVMRHLGGEVIGVQAMTAQYRPELGPESEDLAILNLRFEAGHCGQLLCCHATRGRGASPSVTVFGTEGCLSLDAFGSGMGMVFFPANGPHEVLQAEGSWHNTYDRAISHFLDVVLNGARLRATPEDGRENVRVVLAAYESARTGREVLLL